MSTTRVYQVAKDLGVDPKALLQKLHAWGISVRNTMSALQPEDVTRIKRNLDRESQTNIVEETVRSGVVRRRKIQPAVPKPPRAVEEAAAETLPQGVEPALEAEPATAPPEVVAEEVAEPPAPEPAGVAAPPGDAVPAEPTVAPPVAEAPGASLAPEAPAPAMPATAEELALPAEAPPVPAEPLPAAAAAAPTEPGAPAPTPARPPQPLIPGLTPMPTGPRIISRPVPGRGVPGTEVPRRKEFVRGVNLFDAKNKRLQEQQRYKKKKAAPPGRKGKTTEITTPSEAKRVIQIEEQIALQTLASRMSVKATEVLGRLLVLGMTDAHINKTLDPDTAKLLASEFGYQVEDVAVSAEDLLADARKKVAGDEDIVLRPPVVTVMGHVDHGKTSLLDRIRETNVAQGEAGGITQHIGAYRVDTARGPIVFLDTPGHEAFSAMRARGAQTTDLVVLVVAADDGVMPQTVEAINHAKAAEVPVIVAVNKIDKPDAASDRVKRQLGEHDLIPEDWGGETIFREVSAKTGQGIEELLEMIALQAEIMELKADAAQPATGSVLEAYLDRGRGAVAHVLVRDGTLRAGDIVVAGTAYGKVRAIIDDRGKNTDEAPPATPVEILGLSGVPLAGDPFDVVADARAAQAVVEQRSKKKAPSVAADVGMSLQKLQEMIATGDVPELRIVLKGDVQGSVEAVSSALVRLSGEKVRVSVIHAAAGGITESDVNLAAASKGILVGFNVRPAGKAASVAEAVGVEVKLYSVIYEMLDDVKRAMAGLLTPTTVEKEIGKAEVLQIFNISGVGTVAGCKVVEGKMTRTARIRLVRDSVQVWEGRIGSLRRFKEDVREVALGFECGIGLEGYGDVKQGDNIEAFEMQEVAPSL